MNKSTLISIGIIVVVVVGALVFLQKQSNKPNPLDSFAACLGEKGASFYGAFWCPHCAEQKKLFGTSVKYLPYKECSTPDSKGQTQLCIDAGISSYPTWQYADGSRTTGVQELATLAAKTGCPLPGDTATPVSADIGGTSSVTQ
jgi:hypothetical protein